MNNNEKNKKEPYVAPLLTQHEALRALTGASGKGKETKETID